MIASDTDRYARHAGRCTCRRGQPQGGAGRCALQSFLPFLQSTSRKDNPSWTGRRRGPLDATSAARCRWNVGAFDDRFAVSIEATFGGSTRVAHDQCAARASGTRCQLIAVLAECCVGFVFSSPAAPGGERNPATRAKRRSSDRGRGAPDGLLRLRSISPTFPPISVMTSGRSPFSSRLSLTT